MFTSPTDMFLTKKHNKIMLTSMVNSSAPFDHFRLRVYRILPEGNTDLVFISDPFYGGTSSEEFLLVNADDAEAATNKVGVINGEFYRFVAVEFDTGESVENEQEEWFIFIVPDNIRTVGINTCGALDSQLFMKFLIMMGHNVMDGEFLQPGGYTQQRIRRAYGVDITDEEADELLLTSESPEDVNVIFKSKAIVSTADNGNQLAVKEMEVSVI